MACDSGRDKIDAYADGELAAGEMRAMAEHLKGCPSCTLDLLGRVQWKRSIQTAGKRYVPTTALRQRVEAGISKTNIPTRRGSWVPALAGVLALLAFAFVVFHMWSAYQQAQAIGELADLHVSTLASAAPVDVVSTDRHTVKPWFQGRIPFTFNVPELSSTPFTLEGGRISYLDQAPGAQLIFKTGNHRISVFIFQDRPDRRLPSGDSLSRRLTFNVETWTAGGLRYFVIGDAEAGDIHKLSELLKAAARS